MKLEDIKKVGVVGAGTMGFGIAMNFALWGYKTILNDLNREILKESMSNIKAALTIFVSEGLIDAKKADETMGNIITTTDLSDITNNSDFITEVVTERAEDKKIIFNKLDTLCPPHTIIVSNTSWLLLSDFTSDVRRQEKIAVTHYFVPPHIVPGVEVVKGPKTSEETFKITCEIMKKIGKVPIKVQKEIPGWLFNRIQDAVRREAYRLWAEGVATAEDIDMGIRTTIGFRMPYEGPMMHYDFTGLWRWPRDIRIAQIEKQFKEQTQINPEIVERIKHRMAEGKPWFLDPKNIKEASAKRDREYARCLKQWYWDKREN